MKTIKRCLYKILKASGLLFEVKPQIPHQDPHTEHAIGHSLVSLVSTSWDTILQTQSTLWPLFWGFLQVDKIHVIGLEQGKGTPSLQCDTVLFYWGGEGWCSVDLQRTFDCATKEGTGYREFTYIQQVVQECLPGSLFLRSSRQFHCQP